MSKEMIVIALGLLVAVAPYLGVPGSWKTVLLVAAGLGIAGVGFLLRGESLARGTTQGDGHFVENSASSSSSQAPRDHGIGPLN